MFQNYHDGLIESMAQVVKYLPSKCEALSLNPSMAKKKKVIPGLGI
jgi:hypothetical protein